MLFHSYEFLFLFLPVTLVVFYSLIFWGALRAATWWVGLASLFFYAYWDVRFLFLFIASIIVNYLFGNLIVKRVDDLSKNTLLLLGLVFNLGLLFYFKYTHFFLNSLIAVTGVNFNLPEIILPIGISFFTFTQIAFLVDCRQKPARYKFADYLLFVSFFPHLVAGPILRHDNTIPQFEGKRFGRPSSEKIYMAVLFFSIGLFKKVIIADNLAIYVDPLFASTTPLSTFDAWAAAILYTFQIYFDFSAYSEMAVGLSLLLNVRIPLNFNSPYKSLSIIDFWRRWHISLSTFLRDYLYIPLGGNRKGKLRRYVNLIVTMLLGGLWHGASWTFVIWGGLHGCYLAINHAFKKTGIQIAASLSWATTFLAVILAWVFFRAQSLQAAIQMCQSMIGLHGNAATQINAHPLTMSLLLFMLIAWAKLAPNAQQVVIVRQPKTQNTFACLIMLALGILALGKTDNFIYFQF